MDKGNVSGPFELFMGKRRFDPGEGFTLIVRARSIEVEGPHGILSLKDAGGRWTSTHFSIPVASSETIPLESAVNLAKLISASTGFTFSVLDHSDTVVRFGFIP